MFKFGAYSVWKLRIQSYGKTLKFTSMKTLLPHFTKNFIQRLLLTVSMLLFLGFSHQAMSQTNTSMGLRGDINTFGETPMSYRGTSTGFPGSFNSWLGTIQAGATNGSAGFLFSPVGASFNPKWASGSTVTLNSKTTWFANGANSTYSQTSGNYYTYIIRDVAGGTNTDGYLFQTSAAPVSVSAVSQSPIASSVVPSSTVTVTATTSATLPTGQGVFLRYSLDSFATSTVVNMTGSGTSYVATIPTQLAGVAVKYYVFTSGGTTPPAAADCDLATINLNNNSNSNYSYTVNTPGTIYLHNFNDITGSVVPPYTTSPTATTGTPTGIFAANLSNSSWTNGNATSFTLAGGNSGNSLTVSSVAATPYTLTFNVATGFALSVSSFNYWRQSSQATNSVSSITINGITITSGSVAVPTTGAFIGSTNVANTVSGLTGTITVVINFGGGTGSFRLDEFQLNGNVVSQPGPPTLTTPTAIVTGTTTATLGANITSNGGATITARGTSWKATSPVVATDNQLAEGGTSTGVYTQARTGFSPQTQYFYVGYATNTNGTAISSEGNFRTWSNPATVQPATFTTTAGSSSLVANWSTATFPGSGATQAGYVVIYAPTGSTPTLSSANGNAPTASVGTLINITPTTLPTTPALTTTIPGLTNGTLYNLLLIPYTWDGTNAGTYNYFTTGAKTTTGTPVATTYTWSGGTSGSWLTPGNWTPSTSVAGPTTGDAVIFNTGGNISISASVPTVTLSSITVNTTNTNVTLGPPSTGNSTITLSNAATALSIATGATLNLIGNTTNSRNLSLAYSGAGNTATVAGTLNLQTSGTGTANYIATNSTTTVNGIFRLSSATAVITSTTSNLVIGAAGEFNVASDGGSLPTATWTAGSTLRVTGIVAATAFAANTVSQTFSNVIWDCASQTSDFVFVSVTSTPSLASISGDLTVNRTNTGSLQVPGSDKASISVANFTQTGGTVYVSNGSAASRTLTVTGNFVLNQTTTTSIFNIANTSSVGTHSLNVAGNFTMTAGTISRVAATANVNFNGTGVQTISKTGGTITGIVNFIVPSPSIVSFPATSVLDGTTATFNLNSGATLQTANTGGISASGATGSIQVGSTRTFNAGGNYTYNGAANQVTGNGLSAALTGILTISNTGTSPNNVVTLSQATSTSGTLALTNGSLDLNALTLTLSSNAAQSITGASANTFNITGAANSTLALSAPATSHVVTLSNFGTGLSANLVTGANVNVQLNANTQLDCAGNGTSTSMLTVLGKFTLASGTASNIANVHPPFYGTGSTLLYAVTYGRFSEWNATSGPGYPFNVTVSAGTLNVVNTINTYKKAAGTLTVASGTIFSVADLTTGNGSGVGVEFVGDIINDGTISLNAGSNTTSQRLKGANLTNGSSNTTAVVNLSVTIGGDLELTGNYLDNAVFNANARAVFFTGAGTQTISGTATAPFNIDYIVVTKPSGIVQLGVDLLTGAPNGGNGITLSSATDIFDLNGRTFTLGTAAQTCTILGAGFFRSSSAANMIINGTGNATGTLKFETGNQTIGGLTINRTATGLVTLGTPLTVATTLVVVSTSTLNNGGNALTISAAGSNTVAGIIAGAGALVKTGAGTLTLTAVSGNNTANTYSGGTTINTGGSGIINVTGLTNITSTAIASATQSVTFSTTTPANGTYQLLPGTLTVGTQSFSSNADPSKAVTFNYANSTVTVAPASITTAAITPTSYCQGAAVSVGFTSNTTLSGTYTAQLSDASGSFASPVAIGTGTASPISATIPGGTAAGTGYRIRVVNLGISIVGSDNGSNLTVNPLPTASISGTASACLNSVSPLITFTGTGGTAPYTFSYNINGGATQTVTTAAGSNPQSVTVSAPTSTSGTFNYNLISVSGQFCNQAQTGTATITVNPLPTASISGTASACVNDASPLITFTGTGGTAPYTFSYNINGGATQTVTTAAGSNPQSVTVSAPTSTSGTFNYNLISVSGQFCNQAQTGTATITVNPAPTATIVGNNSPICSGSTATFNLSGTIGAVVTYNINNATNATVTLTGGTASVNVSNATASQTLNLVSVTDGTCTASLSGSSTVIPGASTVWDGSTWSNGTPTSTSTAVISGNFTATGNLTACTLTVDTNAIVDIPSGYNVSLNGALTVTSGSFTLENNANLVQNSSVANSGAIIVKRNSASIMRQDYTLWSSPVASQNLLSFSPNTLTNRFYTYNPSSDTYVAVSSPSTTNFSVGTGYLIRVSNTHPTTPTIWNGQFNGVPNNGNVSLSVGSGTYNAVGNPYPSTVSADSFITGNSLTAPLYFWRKTNNPNQTTTPTTSYATYTLAGGAGTGSNSGDSLGLIPNGTIQVGQGFIARATSSSLNFTNAMRTANNSNQFLRITEDRSRFWLDMKNTDGFASQMMVAYMPGATTGVDGAIDGLFFNDVQTALTSIIEGQEYTIQGRGLPFDTADIVPLGMKSEAAGTFTISINSTDGFFDTDNTPIFLKDNLLGTVHNLRDSAYEFATEAGVFNTRFEVVYTNLLAVNQPAFDANQVVVYKQNPNIVINSGAVKMRKVQVYDIQGRLLIERTNVNASELKLNSGSTNEVLVVKITSENNETITKKIVN